MSLAFRNTAFISIFILLSGCTSRRFNNTSHETSLKSRVGYSIVKLKTHNDSYKKNKITKNEIKKIVDEFKEKYSPSQSLDQIILNDDEHQRIIWVFGVLINLTELLNSFCKNKINIKGFSELKISFEDILKDINNHKNFHDETTEKITNIAKLFSDFCQNQLNRISEVLENLNRLGPAIVAKTQDEVFVNRNLNELVFLIRQFFEKNKHYLRDDERNLICDYLLDSFELDLIKYFSSYKKEINSKKISMTCVEWLPITMYLSLNDLLC